MAYSAVFREAVAYSLRCVHQESLVLKAKQEKALFHLYNGRDAVADAGFKERGGCSGGEITKRGRVREGDVPPPARSAEAFENVNSVC